MKLKNIVLVHGGFVDGSGWEGVYKILKRDYIPSQSFRIRPSRWRMMLPLQSERLLTRTAR